MTKWDGPYWTDATLQSAIESGRDVINIGQISPAQCARLKRMSKAGKLVQSRVYANNHSPIAGIGPLKTMWRLFPED